jgi:hypothetical protein
MRRRDFLRIAGGAVGGMAMAHPGRVFAKAAEPETADMRSLFESDNADVLALAERVFRKCALERVQPPQEPLKHNWVRPGGPNYVGQWIWDTMFVVDLLSILPGRNEVIRDIFQNYWDFQDRRNRKMPDYAHDMITVAIKTAAQAERRFSQIPLLAWGVERVYRRNGDMELLRQCVGRLERRYLRGRKHRLPDTGREVPSPAGGDNGRQGDGCAAQTADRQGRPGHARSHVG